MGLGIEERSREINGILIYWKKANKNPAVEAETQSHWEKSDNGGWGRLHGVFLTHLNIKTGNVLWCTQILCD